MDRYDFCAPREAVRLRRTGDIGVRLTNPIVTVDKKPIVLCYVDGVPRILAIAKELTQEFYAPPELPDVTCAFKYQCSYVREGEAVMKACSDASGRVLVKTKDRAQSESIRRYLSERSIQFLCTELPCALRIAAADTAMPIQHIWRVLQESPFHATWEWSTHSARYKLMPCSGEESPLEHPIIAEDVDTRVTPLWHTAMRDRRRANHGREQLQQTLHVLRNVSDTIARGDTSCASRRWLCSHEPPHAIRHVLDDRLLAGRLDEAYEAAVGARLREMWTMQKSIAERILEITTAIMNASSGSVAICLCAAEAIASSDYDLEKFAFIKDVLECYLKDWDREKATLRMQNRMRDAQTAARSATLSQIQRLRDDQQSADPPTMNETQRIVCNIVSDSWTSAGWLCRIRPPQRAILDQLTNCCDAIETMVDDAPIDAGVGEVRLDGCAVTALNYNYVRSLKHDIWYTPVETELQERRRALQSEAKMLTAALRDGRVAQSAKLQQRPADLILRMRVAIDFLALDDDAKVYARAVEHAAWLYGWKVVKVTDE